MYNVLDYAARRELMNRKRSIHGFFDRVNFILVIQNIYQERGLFLSKQRETPLENPLRVYSRGVSLCLLRKRALS